MSIIALVVILLFLAGILWFVNTRGAGMNGTIKMIINIVIIVIAIIVALSAFGVWDEVKDIQVPKL